MAVDITTTQIIAKAALVTEFREALLEVAGSGGAVNTRRLGNWLRTQRGKLVGSRTIKTAGVREGMGLWRLIGGDTASAGVVVPFPSAAAAEREELNRLLQ